MNLPIVPALLNNIEKSILSLKILIGPTIEKTADSAKNVLRYLSLFKDGTNLKLKLPIPKPSMAKERIRKENV